MTIRLANVPDLGEWQRIPAWIEASLTRIKNAEAGDLVAIDPPAFTVDSVLGVYGSSEWQKFAVSIFAADWASYSKTEDRADFARLLSVVAAFPQGFRLYALHVGVDEYLPVGYTGWYPIAENIFELLHTKPETVTNRGVMMPLKKEKPEGDYIYLFNYSIAPRLVGTDFSREMIKDFTDNISSVKKKGLAAVTVSQHGIRVAEKFGMKYTGDMTHDGDKESVYTAKFDQ